MKTPPIEPIPLNAGDLNRLLIERLERFDKRLTDIEARLPSLESLSEAITRLANHFAPAPANLVGSRYLADRLGCTTAWISRMAINGTIPKSFIASGTGNGRFWKFHRKRIDDWLENRR